MTFTIRPFDDADREACAAILDALPQWFGIAEVNAGYVADLEPSSAVVVFDDDWTTQAVIDAVQADGRIWAGGTTWKGRTAMRISCSDTMATVADIDEAAAVVIELWRSLDAP